MIKQVVTNDKTGKVYLVIDNDVTDCTNVRDGESGVLYMDLFGKTFVRERNEFCKKFTVIQPDDVKYVGNY